MAGRVELDVRIGGETKRRTPGRLGEEGPFRVLVLGDFSARRGREGALLKPPLSERRPIPVDADSFDGVMARLSPALELGVEGGPPSLVEFRELADFHPDALFRRLETFRRLRDLRGELLDPPRAGHAAAELRRLLPVLFEQAEPARISSDSTGDTPSEADAETLDRLLGSRPGARREASADPVSEFVRRLALSAAQGEPAREATPARSVFLSAVDEAAGALMRNVLHDPAFQALEAAWRSLYRLVTSLETGEGLSVHLLDATRGELAADLGEVAGDLRTSGLHRLLVEGEAGGAGWSVLVGDYAFGSEDLGLLGAMGALGARAGGPFLAAAQASLLGCASPAGLSDPGRWVPQDAAWGELRRSEAAPWLGLALPRVLLRLPYGPKTDPVEAFAFDEAGSRLDHEAFLWGNPAFPVALLLAEAYQNPSTVGGGEVEDLPAYTYDEDGESRMLPCAEVWLGERSAEALLARGLLPLMSRRDRNAARAPWLHSLADPPRALAARRG